MSAQLDKNEPLNAQLETEKISNLENDMPCLKFSDFEFTLQDRKLNSFKDEITETIMTND